MGGRSHDVACSHCGAMYGGFDGPAECPCREIVSGGGLPTHRPFIHPDLIKTDWPQPCSGCGVLVGDVWCASCATSTDRDRLTAALKESSAREKYAREDEAHESQFVREQNKTLRARVAELDAETFDIAGWRASVDEVMAQYERCKSDRDSARAEAERYRDGLKQVRLLLDELLVVMARSET